MKGLEAFGVGDRGGVCETGVGFAGGLVEAEVFEEGVVFGELDPGFEFEDWQAKGAGAGFGMGDKAAGEAPALIGLCYREFAEV